jgi:hypothetical protein
MTIEYTQIEKHLGPLRKTSLYDGQMISLQFLQRAHALSLHPEVHQAWAALKWLHTMETPASEWLGKAFVDQATSDLQEEIGVVAFVAFLDRVPVLADGHPWCLLEHQTSGHGCRQIRFLGTRLAVKPDVESEFTRIAAHWYGKYLGCFGLPSLSELAEYRAQLQELGLDCNSPSTYPVLTEAFYPIDLSQEAIDKICMQPFALDSIFGRPRPYGHPAHYATLIFVAPNSD